MTDPSPIDEAALGNIVVVLHEPQNLVNIAGTVRAMMNMGLTRLRLVRPAEFDAYRITGIAHRGELVVDRTEIFDELDDAVADATLVIGTTARARTAHRNYGRPRELAQLAVDRAAESTVVVMFGREDRGLSNEALDLCHRIAVVPTWSDYKSLNLAQAVLVLAYEIFLAAEGGARPLPRGRRATAPATREELEEMFTAIEQGLHRIDFFTRRAPEGVMRTVRTAIGRAEPDGQEAGVLRAIGYEMSRFVNRLEGHSKEAAEDGTKDAP